LANLPPDNPWAQIFGKRPLAGPASFLKQRTVPTTADGIAIGLEPVTTNPVALDLLKMHEMDRYVMGQKIMGELKDIGVAKFVPAGSKPDFGYTKIDDRIARVLAPREWKIVDAEGNAVAVTTTSGGSIAPAVTGFLLSIKGAGWDVAFYCSALVYAAGAVSWIFIDPVKQLDLEDTDLT